MDAKKKSALAATLICLLMVASAYAVLKYTGTVSNTVNVTGYGLSLWRTDTNVAVTSIPWGDVDIGSTKNTEQVFAFVQQLKFKNTGDKLLYVGWNVTTLPPGFAVIAEYENGGWNQIPQNNYNTLSAIAPGQISTYAVRFTLTISGAATRGPANFTINLNAADSASG